MGGLIGVTSTLQRHYKMGIDRKFNEAIEARNRGDLNIAVKEFKSIVKVYSTDPKIHAIHSVLGGVYNDLGLYIHALNCFRKATELKPSSELASMGLYLAYVEVKNYPRAIGELKRYLEEYPANHYRITLEELLTDLKNGYAVNFKETIIRLAKKHQVGLS